MLNNNQKRRVHVARELISLSEELLSTIEDETQHSEITRAILILKSEFIRLGGLLK